VFKHSPSELVLCYLASNDFLIGGRDEQELAAFVCDVVPIEAQCVSEVAAVDAPNGV
jgi:hypothetical protein